MKLKGSHQLSKDTLLLEHPELMLYTGSLRSLRYADHLMSSFGKYGKVSKRRSEVGSGH